MEREGGMGRGKEGVEFKFTCVKEEEEEDKQKNVS